jgi:hypothetical protein
MFNPRELLRRLSPPTCPSKQKSTCVIGLVWMVVLLIYTALIVPGCYISWQNGQLEIGEGTKLAAPPKSP